MPLLDTESGQTLVPVQAMVPVEVKYALKFIGPNASRAIRNIVENDPAVQRVIAMRESFGEWSPSEPSEPNDFTG